MKLGKSGFPRRFMAALLSAALMIPMMATSAFAAEENLITTPTKLPDAIKDVSYAVKMESDRDVAIWRADALPDGLTINSDSGVISGIPTTAGDYNVFITDYNYGGNPNLKQFTLKVLDSASVPVITIPANGSRVMEEGHLGVAYREQFEATGGDIHWYAEGLPAGLNIDLTTGLVTGIPTESGKFTVTITAENTAGNEVRDYSLEITSIPEIATTGLPDGMKDEPYNTTLRADGDGNITWFAENLPRGLEIESSTGIISGTPVESGKFDVTITASSTAGEDTITLTLVIGEEEPEIEVPSITTTTLASGMVGEEYTAEFKADGTAPFTWSANGLPDGLSMNKDTGVISGEPVSAGTFSVDVTAANEAGEDTVSLSLVINASPSSYTISGSIDNGGRIEGANPQTVRGGNDSEMMKFVPADGFRIQKVLVNGIEETSARGKTSYTFEAVSNVDKDYIIVVTTERIPSREAGLGIDNITVNYGDDISATNAGGEVEVGNVSDYDEVGFRAGQHTVAFIPEDGWEHASTFDVAVTDENMNVTRFTMKVPYSTGSLSIANSSSGTQDEWDDLFPEAKATVRGRTVSIRFADDADDMPYQVFVEAGFEPTLTARASSNGGDVSASNYSVYAEADSRYKVSKVVLVDPVTDKSLTITNLPKRENSRGEYYDRDTGDFAGLLNTRIGGETAKVWIEGNIDVIKSGGYITEMDVYLDELPIALKAEVSFSKRNADDTENDDYDQYIFDDNTGNLTIKNVVKNGSNNKAFTFTLYFPAGARDEEYEIDGDVRGWVEHGDQIILYGGEQATIYGLPEGTRYSIEMDDPGARYKTDIDVSNGDELEDTLDTGNFSIRDGKLTTVVFTNVGGQTDTDTPAANGGNGTTTPVVDDGKKDNPHTGR